MILSICIYVVCLAAWVLLLKYNLQMFQQNSNRPERFWRWFVANLMPHPLRKSKVKFVFTPRMVRLSVTSTILAVLACVFAPAWVAVIVVALTPFVMLLANLVNTPVEKAINRGYYRDAQRKLRSHPGLIIIGVTGSYGKTSTKNYLHRILSEKYNVLMTPGNFNTTLGVVRTIREKLEPYHQVFIVEMGAKQVGDIAEICELVHPTIGVVTAVGEMHLETFLCKENIQKTKFELIRSLPADGLGVINEDSALIASYADVPDHCRIIRYGVDAHRCDVRGGNVVYTSSGMEFDMVGPKDSLHLQTKLLGECNILNLEAAAVVAQHLGVSDDRIRMAVSKILPVEHRLSMSRRGSLTILDDAYNSNPDGAAMALDVLRRMVLPEGGRRIVVTPGFVEMGSRQAAACRELGLRASRAADILIIVNRYNREAILEGAHEGGMDENNILCADNLNEAVAALGVLATAGSVVLYENDLPDTFK